MQDNKNVLQVMLGRHNATAPMSSYSRVKLDVKTQSYFFVHSVKALTVTTTARGITGKQILVGSVSDQVCNPLLPVSPLFVTDRGLRLFGQCFTILGHCRFLLLINASLTPVEALILHQPREKMALYL